MAAVRQPTGENVSSGRVSETSGTHLPLQEKARQQCQVFMMV